MSRSPFLIARLALLVLAAEGGVPRVLDAKPRARPVQVSADNLISGKAVVIGRLGIPLKTMATIRGVWKDPHVDKEAHLRFYVTQVDGNALKDPVEFKRTQVEVDSPPVDDERAEDPGVPAPKAGHLWEFRGFETGAFHRRPEEFGERLGATLQQEPEHGRFVTRLEGVIPRPCENPSAAGKAQPPRLKVSAEDLNSGKGVVIGSLQLPLQTMATIRGVWRFPPRGDVPAKDGSPTFHVTHINGALVKQPATFHRNLVRMSRPRSEKDIEDEAPERPNPRDSEVLEFRGFESGGFFGMPGEFQERLGMPTSAAPTWQRGEFVTHLEGIFAKPAREKTEKQVDKASLPEGNDAHTLIAGLRNRNKPPPRYSGKLGRPALPDDYDWDEQGRVITVWRKIDERAADFLPALVQHMDDPEYCVTSVRGSGICRNHTVGDICRTMVERNVMPVRLFDKGFRGYSPWSKLKGGVREFLASRRHMPLQEIQRESLTQLLDHLTTLPDSKVEETGRMAIEERLSKMIDKIDEIGQPITVRTARGDSLEFMNIPIPKNFEAAPLEKGK